MAKTEQVMQGRVGNVSERGKAPFFFRQNDWL